MPTVVTILLVWRICGRAIGDMAEALGLALMVVAGAWSIILAYLQWAA